MEIARYSMAKRVSFSTCLGTSNRRRIITTNGFNRDLVVVNSRIVSEPSHKSMPKLSKEHWFCVNLDAKQHVRLSTQILSIMKSGLTVQLVCSNVEISIRC